MFALQVESVLGPPDRMVHKPQGTDLTPIHTSDLLFLALIVLFLALIV